VLIGIAAVAMLHASDLAAQVDREATIDRAGGESDDRAIAEEVQTIHCAGRIERRLDANANQIYFAEVTPPVLEGSRKYRLDIKIVNPFDEIIAFSDVSLTCGCAKFETKENEIPALGAAEFVMHLDVPNQTAMPMGRVIATFLAPDADPKPALRMAVTYQLHGVFGFDRNREIVELPKSEDVAVLKLPIKLVAPMTLEKLELKYSDNMRDFNVKIIDDDPEASVPYVSIEVPRRALPRQGTTGEVGLRRKGTKHVAGVIISFRHQDTFTLQPESLRLTRENRSKPYQTTAMLRVHIPKDRNPRPVGEQLQLEQQRGRGEISAPQVGLSIGGQSAQVKVQKLGPSGLYRLTVQYGGPLEVDSDGTVPVRWRVVFNGEERVIESHAFLADR
jgi:hypothetical protein